jgi:thiosulfate/3-mercaptopyruvate sulfurtransferase
MGNVMNLSNHKVPLLCFGACLFVLVALMHGAQASECGELAHFIGKNCTTGSADAWDPMAELENMGTSNADQSSQQTQTNWAKVSRQYRWNQPVNAFNNSSLNNKDTTSPPASRATAASVATPETKPVTQAVSEPAKYVEPTRSRNFYQMAASLSDVSAFDIILDVSSGATQYIPGSIHIDYQNFQTNGSLKQPSELAKVLGAAGISRNSSVLIYGDCKCGLGPSVATYAYWIMRYLGHDPKKVAILDGRVEDWVAANHSAANRIKNMSQTVYSIDLRPEFLATFDETDKAMSNQVKVIDARMPQDFGSESILGSTNLPFNQLMSNWRIKDEAALQKMFQGIPKNKPVIVYSNEGVEGSFAWFALEMMGYQAKLYTWKDWTEHNK